MMLGGGGGGGTVALQGETFSSLHLQCGTFFPPISSSNELIKITQPVFVNTGGLKLNF